MNGGHEQSLHSSYCSRTGPHVGTVRLRLLIPLWVTYNNRLTVNHYCRSRLLIPLPSTLMRKHT